MLTIEENAEMQTSLISNKLQSKINFRKCTTGFKCCVILLDIANPKSNTKNPGFTIEERQKFTELLEDGFVDSYRHLYPDQKGTYTFWSFLGTARQRNIGWFVSRFTFIYSILV